MGSQPSRCGVELLGRQVGSGGGIGGEPKKASRPSPLDRRGDEGGMVRQTRRRFVPNLRGDGAAPTNDLCVGAARLKPGGWLFPHRHSGSEIAQVIYGAGRIT